MRGGGGLRGSLQCAEQAQDFDARFGQMGATAAGAAVLTLGGMGYSASGSAWRCRGTICIPITISA